MPRYELVNASDLNVGDVLATPLTYSELHAADLAVGFSSTEADIDSAGEERLEVLAVVPTTIGRTDATLLRLYDAAGNIYERAYVSIAQVLRDPEDTATKTRFTVQMLSNGLDLRPATEQEVRQDLLSAFSPFRDALEQVDAGKGLWTVPAAAIQVDGDFAHDLGNGSHMLVHILAEDEEV